MSPSWASHGAWGGAWVACARASPSAAQPVCGGRYVSAPGDSLPAIAAAAYGDELQWPRVYEYLDNAQRLGADVTSILQGTAVDLPPCFGAADRSAEAPAVEGLSERTTFEEGVSRIEILTASAPRLFVDRSAPENGIVPHLVKAAFAAAGQKISVDITFVEDRIKGLDTLLWRNKFDFGLPWVKPDCRNPLALPPNLQILCDYEFSDPIYTVSVVHFRRDDSAWTPSSYLDLIGWNLCRPLEDDTLNIQERGLLGGGVINEFRPDSVAECFFQLQNGWADFVAATRYEAADALALGGLAERASLMPSLVSARPVHLITPKHSPERVMQLMDAFNEGLRRIKEDGTYDRIVNWHLSALDAQRRSLAR